MLDVDIYVFEEKNSGDFTVTAFNIFKPMKILESWPNIVFLRSEGWTWGFA